MRVPRRVLCVDWDRRAVRLVVAKVGGGSIALEDAHSHRVPEDVEVDDPQQMGALLAQLIKLHKWRHSRVIVDVAREKAVINRLQLPPTPSDEVAAAVQFQAMRELPFPAEQAVIDFVVTERNDEGMVVEVLIAAVRREALDRLRETCVAGGLTPVRIGLRPYANVVSVHHLPDAAAQRVMLVDVGPTMTEIDIVHGRSLLFSRAVNVVLPSRQSPPPSEAEGAGPDASAPDSSLGLDFVTGESEREAAVRDLEVEVTRTLQSYRATDPDATVDRVVIAGGTGYETELQQSIARRFSLPCDLFDPAAALGLSEEEGAKLRSFSAALGLAWGLSREGMLELDFINPKRPIPRSETVKRQLTLAGTAAAAVVAIVVGLLVWDFSVKQAEADRLAKALATLRAQEKERVLIQTQVQRVHEAAEIEPVWLDDLLNLTESMLQPPEGGKPPNAGENLLVRKITFDGKLGRIQADLLARSADDINRLETAMSEDFRDANQPVYRVGGFGLDPDTDREPFKVKTTFDIDLEQVQKRQDKIAAAEKERSKKVKLK